jgi:hypothetical protein
MDGVQRENIRSSARHVDCGLAGRGFNDGEEAHAGPGRRYVDAAVDWIYRDGPGLCHKLIRPIDAVGVGRLRHSERQHERQAEGRGEQSHVPDDYFRRPGVTVALPVAVALAMPSVAVAVTVTTSPLSPLPFTPRSNVLVAPVCLTTPFTAQL